MGFAGEGRSELLGLGGEILAVLGEVDGVEAGLGEIVEVGGGEGGGGEVDRPEGVPGLLLEGEEG